MEKIKTYGYGRWFALGVGFDLVLIFLGLLLRSAYLLFFPIPWLLASKMMHPHLSNGEMVVGFFSVFILNPIFFGLIFIGIGWLVKKFVKKA